MRLTEPVRNILKEYASEPPGVQASLARILMHGALGGTGKLLILPVDQGFEHGPMRSFAANPAAYDPHYFFELALDAGLSAFAAPLGLLRSGATEYAGALPLILKANNSDSLASSLDQAVTATVRDALELGCSAIGFTVYPGSEHQYGMFEEVRAAAAEARSSGLAVVVWAYPRGPELSREGETALDVVCYAAHIACLLGAHIVKVKLPGPHIETREARSACAGASMDLSTLERRVANVMHCAFDHRRIVVFSGGPSKELAGLYDEVRAIRDGGGHGSILGRNSFQRPREEALAMLETIVDIYRGGEP